MDRVNLFVIGVNKAGTGWLYFLLDGHPEIFMCAEKELYYFGARQPEELRAYHAHFPFDASYRYFGEATPTYWADKRVAHRIHEYAPHAKILAVVRDPIGRLHSHFCYAKQLGMIDETVSAADLAGSDTAELRANSHYERMLPVYAEIFGRDQFKVVSLEESTADLPVFWNELQAFLDLPAAPLPASGTRPTNATGGRAFRALYRRTVRPVKRHAPAVYRAMLRSEWASTVKSTLLSLLGTARRDPIPDGVKAALLKEYRPTYRYLAELGFEYYEEGRSGSDRRVQSSV